MNEVCENLSRLLKEIETENTDLKKIILNDYFEQILVNFGHMLTNYFEKRIREFLDISLLDEDINLRRKALSYILSYDSILHTLLIEKEVFISFYKDHLDELINNNNEMFSAFMDLYTVLVQKKCKNVQSIYFIMIQMLGNIHRDSVYSFFKHICICSLKDNEVLKNYLLNMNMPLYLTEELKQIDSGTKLIDEKKADLAICHIFNIVRFSLLNTEIGSYFLSKELFEIILKCKTCSQKADNLRWQCVSVLCNNFQILDTTEIYGRCLQVLNDETKGVTQSYVYALDSFTMILQSHLDAITESFLMKLNNIVEQNPNHTFLSRSVLKLYENIMNFNELAVLLIRTCSNFYADHIKDRSNLRVLSLKFLLLVWENKKKNNDISTYLKHDKKLLKLITSDVMTKKKILERDYGVDKKKWYQSLLEYIDLL